MKILDAYKIKAVMLSRVEAWWAGLCALPFDVAQGDTRLSALSEVYPSHKPPLPKEGIAQACAFKKNKTL
jgi:hypothetical protein